MHNPVLLDETLSALINNPDGLYVDVTFGRGGHSQALLDRLSKSARLWVFDKDPEAILVAKELAAKDSRVTVFYAGFAELKSTLEKVDLLGQVDGVMADLGVSSPQLDQGERGFAFMKDGPLDMRMNNQVGPSVADLIADVSETTLADIIWRYGQERKSRRIAKAIVRAREEKRLTRTAQLAEVISRAIPGYSKKHPATQTFQALRIHINGELDELQTLLNDSQSILAVGGRLAMISFHSLEDGLVKAHAKKLLGKGDDPLPRHLPVRHNATQALIRWHVKNCKANRGETEDNPRARSATLRVWERVI